MSQIEAAILGVVQGLSEFLPISSSAHLIFISEWLGGRVLPLSLNIAMHMGTLLAVLMYFWRDWWFLFSGSVKRRVSGLASDPNADRLLINLFIGSIPAGVIGILFKDDIEHHLHHPLVLVAPLSLVGVALYLIDIKTKGSRQFKSLSRKQALQIGCFQALALIPGVSRSGSTIIGGLLSGMGREEAARFSFLLGAPAMLGAFLLEMDQILQVADQPEFIIGVTSSFLTGCLAIKFFLRFLARFGFLFFAVYRVVLAIAIGIMFL